MIEIEEKKDCVGCNACVQVCPKQCISMHEDEQGFLYPKVNKELCIGCGLCERVCPVINQAVPNYPLSSLAAKNKDGDVQQASSSGGLFKALASHVIKNGGVVFGARFNENWEVVHDYAQAFDELEAFQTSKYVQSKIGTSFIKAKKFLQQGRMVLFSGTPCQLAGLKLYLMKDYENLIAVDIVCHGVPSPLIWKEYLSYAWIQVNLGDQSMGSQSLANVNKKNKIAKINFRDKKIGWTQYGLSIFFNSQAYGNDTSYNANNSTPSSIEFFESHKDNLYMQAFLKDLDLRPSCYSCPAKCGKSQSDLTLADFWGIKTHYPQFYDAKGVSLILVHTQKALDILNQLPVDSLSVRYSDALAGNPSIEKSVGLPKESKLMWDHFEKDGIEGIKVVLERMKPSITKRMINKLKNRSKSMMKRFKRF